MDAFRDDPEVRHNGRGKTVLFVCAKPGTRIDNFIQELYDLYEEEEHLDVVGVHNDREFEITDLDAEPIRRSPDQREFTS